MKAVVGTSLASVGWVGMVNDAAYGLFNVPVTVVAMAAAGAMLSFAYADNKQEPLSRKRLFLLVAANTALAAAAVAVFPGWFGWDWAGTKMEGSMALLFGAAARFVIPIGITLIPALLRKWFKIGEYRGEGK